jgi:hypothetical protein
MGTLQLLILIVGTFVVPAVVILADNEQNSSRDPATPPAKV